MSIVAQIGDNRANPGPARSLGADEGRLGFIDAERRAWFAEPEGRQATVLDPAIDGRTRNVQLLGDFGNAQETRRPRRRARPRAAGALPHPAPGLAVLDRRRGCGVHALLAPARRRPAVPASADETQGWPADAGLARRASRPTRAVRGDSRRPTPSRRRSRPRRRSNGGGSGPRRRGAAGRRRPDRTAQRRLAKSWPRTAPPGKSAVWTLT
jgi:hypothetical protein